MGLFTKKKLTDLERQSWSAQLLEVREAELERFGEAPTLGTTWDEHDSAYGALFLEYYTEFGVLAWDEMDQDGHRPAGYRAFLLGQGMIMLADEVEEPPTDWSPGEVYWVVNTGEFDANGDQIWLYQYVSSSWSDAKKYMKDRVKEWDLENTRKTNKLYLEHWNLYYKIVATAITIIVGIIVLFPVIAGGLTALALGETVSLTGAFAAGSKALATSLAFANTALLTGVGGAIFQQFSPEADSFFSGADVIGGHAALIEAMNADPEGVPVFQPDGEIVMEDNAPTDSPASSSTGGLIPLLVAAAGYMIFI